MMEKKNVWKTFNSKQTKEVDTFAAEYMDFLNKGKTERECIDTIVNEIEAEGYRELHTLIQKGEKLKKGDKAYAVWMNKTIVMFHMGEQPMTEGMNILGAHIDSPRLDIKQNPLYEDGGFALLDTHYYGGVKKYQWVTIPLAIHGVVVKKDGTTIEINIGESEDDPVFFVSDLLIHLAQDQMSKSAKDVVEGDSLNLIVGGQPLKDTEKDAVWQVLKRCKSEPHPQQEHASLNDLVTTLARTRNVIDTILEVLSNLFVEPDAPYESMSEVIDSIASRAAATEPLAKTVQSDLIERKPTCFPK